MTGLEGCFSKGIAIQVRATSVHLSIVSNNHSVVFKCGNVSRPDSTSIDTAFLTGPLKDRTKGLDASNSFVLFVWQSRQRCYWIPRHKTLQASKPPGLKSDFRIKHNELSTVQREPKMSIPARDQQNIRICTWITNNANWPSKHVICR